jgi:hypothetical protein
MYIQGLCLPIHFSLICTTCLSSLIIAIFYSKALWMPYDIPYFFYSAVHQTRLFPQQPCTATTVNYTTAPVQTYPYRNVNVQYGIPPPVNIPSTYSATYPGPPPATYSAPYTAPPPTYSSVFTTNASTRKL